LYTIGPNITIADTSLLYRGGGLAGDVRLDPAHLWNGWMNIGTRPSWGWFLRHANGVTFDRLHLQLDRPDGRPSIIVEDARNITCFRAPCG
jgi:hypothetical protein